MKHFLVYNDLGNAVYFDHPDGRMLVLPVNATDLILDENFNEGLCEVATQNGDGERQSLFLFAQFDNLTVMAVSDEGDSSFFLRRQLHIVHELVCFLFGPRVWQELSTSKHKSLTRHARTLDSVLSVLKRLAGSEQGVAVQCLESVQLNEDIKHRCRKALDAAVASVPKARHAVLFVGPKLVATNTRPKGHHVSNEDLMSVAMLLEAVFIQPVAAPSQPTGGTECGAGESDRVRWSSSNMARARGSVVGSVASASNDAITEGEGSLRQGRDRLLSGDEDEDEDRDDSSFVSAKDLTEADDVVDGPDSLNSSGECGVVSSGAGGSEDACVRDSNDATDTQETFYDAVPVVVTTSRSSTMIEDHSFYTPMATPLADDSELVKAVKSGKETLSSLRTDLQRSQTSRTSQTSKTSQTPSPQALTPSPLGTREPYGGSLTQHPPSKRNGSRRVTQRQRVHTSPSKNKINKTLVFDAKHHRVDRGDYEIDYDSDTTHVRPRWGHRTGDDSARHRTGDDSARKLAAMTGSSGMSGGDSSGSGGAAATAGNGGGGRDDVRASVPMLGQERYGDDRRAPSRMMRASVGSADMLNTLSPSNASHDVEDSVDATISNSPSSDAEPVSSTQEHDTHAIDPETSRPFDGSDWCLKGVRKHQMFFRTSNVSSSGSAPGVSYFRQMAFFDELCDDLRVVILCDDDDDDDDDDHDNGVGGDESIEATISSAVDIVKSELASFQQFIVLKGHTHVSMMSYVQDFPGLVHFIFVDRTQNQMLAPTLVSLHNPVSSGASGMSAQQSIALLKRKVWNMIRNGHESLSHGYLTVLAKVDGMQMSYRLWFEDSDGNDVAIETTLPPTSNLSMDVWYSQLSNKLFPNVKNISIFELFTLYVGGVSFRTVSALNRRLASRVAVELRAGTQ